MMSQPEGHKECPDPLIDEVRRIRKSLSDRFDNDVGKLCDYLQHIDNNSVNDWSIEREISNRLPLHRSDVNHAGAWQGISLWAVLSLQSVWRISHEEPIDERYQPNALHPQVGHLRLMA
jgi:hypothetical protein